MACVHEYAVTVSDQLSVASALEDPIELLSIFKRETIHAAKECIRELPRTKCGFASGETVENFEESRAARLAGKSDSYRALSCGTRVFLRDEEKYVRNLEEQIEGHFLPTGLLSRGEALPHACLSSTCYLISKWLHRVTHGQTESSLD